VLSQLNRHSEAFEFGRKSAEYAQILIEKSSELTKLFVEDIKKRRNTILSNKRASCTSADELEDNCSPYGPKASHPKHQSHLQQSTESYYNGSIDNTGPQYFGTSRNSMANKSVDSQGIRRASSTSGSLERIHTFNLKASYYQDSSKGDSMIDGGTGAPPNIVKVSAKGGLANNQSFKAYYVEDKAKVLEDLIIKVDPVVKELASIVAEFDAVQGKTAIERSILNRRALRISFWEDSEFAELKRQTKLKLNVRNILGVKHQDDWVFNLNIGNVMHLAPMNSDELSVRLDRTHELNKDAMLEKIILFVVSYFCVGTELRFLSQRETETKVSRKDSEIWHAKSLHVAALFLPDECPLVNHVINSYKKHHMMPKIE